MAVKNLIANGIGFSPVAYVITDGLGSYGAGFDPSSWWRAKYLAELRKRRQPRKEHVFGIRARAGSVVASVALTVDNSMVVEEEAFVGFLLR